VITAFVPDLFSPEAVEWVQRYFATRHMALENLEWRDLPTPEELAQIEVDGDDPIYVFGSSAFVSGQDFVQLRLDEYETVLKEWARRGQNAHLVWLQQNADGSWSLVLKTTGNALLQIESDKARLKE